MNYKKVGASIMNRYVAFHINGQKEGKIMVADTKTLEVKYLDREYIKNDIENGEKYDNIIVMDNNVVVTKISLGFDNFVVLSRYNDYALIAGFDGMEIVNVSNKVKWKEIVIRKSDNIPDNVGIDSKVDKYNTKMKLLGKDEQFIYPVCEGNYIYFSKTHYKTYLDLDIPNFVNSLFVMGTPQHSPVIVKINGGKNLETINIKNARVGVVPELSKIPSLKHIKGLKRYQGSELVLKGIEVISEGAFSMGLYKSLYIHDGDIRIEDEAFSYTHELKEARLPIGLKYIPERCFWSCTNLEKVEIPNTVEVIRNEAFRSCIGLRKLKIPQGVKKLEGQEIFKECHRLAVIVLPRSLKEFDNKVFLIDNLERLLMPKELYNEHKDTIELSYKCKVVLY